MKTVHLPGFTAERSVYVSGAQYSVTATNFSVASAGIRPQRGFDDPCAALSRRIQHYYYLYGLDVLSGDSASAAQNLQKIDDLQQLSAFC
jgi:hypothetical protein